MAPRTTGSPGPFHLGTSLPPRPAKRPWGEPGRGAVTMPVLHRSPQCTRTFPNSPGSRKAGQLSARCRRLAPLGSCLSARLAHAGHWCALFWALFTSGKSTVPSGGRRGHAQVPRGQIYLQAGSLPGTPSLQGRVGVVAIKESNWAGEGSGGIPQHTETSKNTKSWLTQDHSPPP